MAKKIIIAVIVIAVVVIALFFLLKKPQMPFGTVLFYGDTCSHCKNVEDYITANKVEEKVALEKKEVFNDQNNARILERVAAFCGLPTDEIGVPFLWDSQNKRCLVGDADIINFFETKINE